MRLSREDQEILRTEIAGAEETLADARRSSDPLATLGGLNAVIDTLTATQHELVNVLLDRGASWSTIAQALSTSSASAQRRYPRRASRTGSREPATSDGAGH